MLQLTLKDSKTRQKNETDITAISLWL